MPKGQSKYSQEFKEQAISLVTERGYTHAEAANQDCLCVRSSLDTKQSKITAMHKSFLKERKTMVSVMSSNKYPMRLKY